MGQRSHSIGRTVTCNGGPKARSLSTCAPAIWTKVMQTESKQKTPSHSAWSESLYLCRRKLLPVSQNYFRSRDNHFRLYGNRKYSKYVCKRTAKARCWPNTYALAVDTHVPALCTQDEQVLAKDTLPICCKPWVKKGCHPNHRYL